MKILITLCARGGSKGIPGKNIKPLAGIPLIGYSIVTANKIKDKYKSVDIVLSTDSDKIMDVAAEYDLSTEYKRPDSLAGDKVGKLDAIQDVLSYYENKNHLTYDFIIDLDVTSPLRNLEDIQKAFDLLLNDSNALNIFSVSEANRNPYFNMVEKKETGYFGLIKKMENSLLTRQSSPKVYDLNASFYIYRRKFFNESYKTAITDRSLIYLMPHICFDLDHPIDFEIMSYLVDNNKLDFKL